MERRLDARVDAWTHGWPREWREERRRVGVRRRRTNYRWLINFGRDDTPANYKNECAISTTKRI